VGVLPAILSGVASDLHASSVDAYWSGAVYLFGMTMTQPVFGGLAETVGRRTCTMVALGTFIIASLLSATAQTISWLIGARLVCSV
jgi:MFS family permease